MPSKPCMHARCTVQSIITNLFVLGDMAQDNESNLLSKIGKLRRHIFVPRFKNFYGRILKFEV